MNVIERYHALVAAGELKPDADQAQAVTALAAEHALAVVGPQAGTGTRPVSVGRCRPGEIHADGPFFRQRGHKPQTAGAFP